MNIVILQCIKLLSVHNVFEVSGVFYKGEYPSDIIHYIYIYPFVTGTGLTAVASEIV